MLGRMIGAVIHGVLGERGADQEPESREEVGRLVERQDRAVRSIRMNTVESLRNLGAGDAADEWAQNYMSGMGIPGPDSQDEANGEEVDGDAS